MRPYLATVVDAVIRLVCVRAIIAVARHVGMACHFDDEAHSM